MVVYNFKKIQVVPKATELIDIVLPMAQKKTPTGFFFFLFSLLFSFSLSLFIFFSPHSFYL